MISYSWLGNEKQGIQIDKNAIKIKKNTPDYTLLQQLPPEYFNGKEIPNYNGLPYLLDWLKKI